MPVLPEGFEVEQSSIQLPEGFEIEQSDDSFIGAGIIEPTRAIASSLGRSVVGGILGIGQSINPFADVGAGAEKVKELQEGAFKPETPEGQENLKIFGELVQKGVDIVNFPISGLFGLSELIAGEGIDKAAESIKSVQDKGFAKTLGQRTFEETGDPLAATIAETFPAFIDVAIGSKAIGSAAKATRSATDSAIKKVSQAASEVPGKILEGAAKTVEAITPAIKEGKEIAKGVFEFQTPLKKRIAKEIEEGSTDVDTAKFKLEPGDKSVTDKPRTKIREFLDIGGPKVKTDKVAVEAIDQGFDGGVVAVIKGANSVDRANMVKQVNIMEKAKKNSLFAMTNRPSDVAGAILMDRLKSVVDANKVAGKELGVVANSLKGQKVDFEPAINSFVDDLGSLGVGLTDDLKPIFKGSAIEGLSGPEMAIKRMINRMKDIKNPDAKSLHDFKRFIDEQVTFGKNVKTSEGLTGRTESVLKSLRHNIDSILDKQFPEYDRVNTVFAETIGAIDSLQDVAGRKMDLAGPNAQKATGTLLRRLMSNAQSRINLLDAIVEIDGAAFKHGGSKLPKLPGDSPGRADLLTQVLFVDELDAVFGTVAKTSFQGDIGKAVKKGVEGITSKSGAIDLGIQVGGKAVEKARGINQAGAFKAIKELLKEGD